MLASIQEVGLIRTGPGANGMSFVFSGSLGFRAIRGFSGFRGPFLLLA